MENILALVKRLPITIWSLLLWAFIKIANELKLKIDLTLKNDHAVPPSVLCCAHKGAKH